MLRPTMRATDPAPAKARDPDPVGDVIVARRSTRRFLPREVPDDLLHEVLDLARRAPSSMNGQACHFVVVRSKDTLRRLVEAKNRACPPAKRAYPADFLLDAPVVVVVCIERERVFSRDLENAVLASGFLLLAARSRGLGSVFLTAYQPDGPALTDEVRALLELPPGIDPLCIVPLGFPDPGEPLPVKELRPLQEIVHHERFGRELRGGDRPPA